MCLHTFLFADILAVKVYVYKKFAVYEYLNPNVDTNRKNEIIQIVVLPNGSLYMYSKKYKQSRSFVYEKVLEKLLEEDYEDADYIPVDKSDSFHDIAVSENILKEICSICYDKNIVNSESLAILIDCQ